MSWIVTILLATAMFVTLVFVWIGLDTMRHYKWALAKLVRSDYSTSERHYDYLADMGSEARIWFKLVSMRIEFDTPGQKGVLAHHKRWEFSGSEQKGCYPIWYHCDNPEKTTAYGPGFWLVVAAVSACLAFTIVLDPGGWQEFFRGLWI